jgi:hypothetical protein
MNRRDFLADVGRGMLVAGIGAATASELGLCSARADDTPQRLEFGKLEPLVALIQETPANKCLPILVEKVRDGVELRTLVAAASLANARTMGGHDYDGYHAFMALLPSLQMARELPTERQALPVLKVIYRNIADIQAFGGRKNEKLRPVQPIPIPNGVPGGEALRAAVRKRDIAAADGTFAQLAHGKPEDAFNDLQGIVQDDLNVHRIVLAWRAWATLDLTGPEHAQTLLRQSIHFCVTDDSVGHIASAIQPVLPKLLDQYKLLDKTPGKREAEDGWVEKLAKTIHGDPPAVAAEAVAAALAEGFSPEAIGEAMSLAANRLLLCDRGRGQAKPGKPVRSVHGDSVGVHASDAANAWRNVARVSNARNTMASLICGAFHTAGQARGMKDPLPLAEQLDKVTSKEADKLLSETEAAIKDNDQMMACALVRRYGDLGHAARPLFDLLLRYAVSEDGSLHAEKYYRTVVEEFEATRAAFRWRHLIGLARVTASEYGERADGYEEACRLLKVANP